MTPEQDPHQPLLTLENVSKEYPPAPNRRIRKAMSRFRGVRVDDPFPGEMMGDDDDDDDDDVDDDDEGALLERPPERDTWVLAVDNVSMQAHAGESIGIVGPAGSGKSVLIKLMSGVVRPTEGRIVTRGLVAPALMALASSYPSKGQTLKAALPQLGAMMGLPHALVRSRLDQLEEFLRYPRLDGVSCDSLEGRQKREIIFALALSMEPDVLLISSPLPSGSLGERCVERIEELRARGTLVIAEMNGLRMWQPRSVIVLEQGRIVRESTFTAVAPARKKGGDRAPKRDRAQAEADVRARAEALAREHAEARERAETQVRAHAESEARARAESEVQVRAHAEGEARARAEAEARAQAEAEARERAKAEARKRERQANAHEREKARLQETHMRREARLREKARIRRTAHLQLLFAQHGRTFVDDPEQQDLSSDEVRALPERQVTEAPADDNGGEHGANGQADAEGGRDPDVRDERG